MASIQRAPVRVCRQDKPFLQIPALLKELSGSPHFLVSSAAFLTSCFAGEAVSVGSLLKQQLPDLFAKDIPSAQVLVHGIEISPDTPLEWLAVNMAHPDGFLYLAVLPAPS